MAVNTVQSRKAEKSSATSFQATVLSVLRNVNFHRAFLTFLFVYYALLYYFGEIVDLAGWESLRWDFFFGIHDVHRLFFIIPVIYAGYCFRVKGAIITTLAAFIVFLPRALYISPFTDPLIRAVLFSVIAGTTGVLTGIARNEYERRRHLEGVIRSERDKLLGILEKIEEGVIIVGLDHRIRFINSSMIREFGEVTDVSCYEYLYDSNTPCNQNCKLSSVLSGNTESWEYNFPDGRTYEVLAVPYVDSDGVLCQLATFRNITQRKKVELELLELDRLKSELLSNVSHELRSPLTSIKGIISSLLQKDVVWDDETREMLLTGISEETDRLTSLVTNLLNMSRLEAGVWQPQKDYCHISDIINGALEQQRWINKNHVFRTEIPPDLPELYADYNQIKQIVINLLENAAAHSGEGTQITVSAKTVDGMLQVSISDQGVGIPEKDLIQIFDKFYRGTPKREIPGGTGLGLAICQALVQTHGGQIWVESEAGHGSTFYFKLPINGSDNK